MSRNGSGAYSATVSGGAYPASSGTLIESAKFNTLIADVETAMTQSVSKDGQTAMTGNLPMGSNKVTGMANGTSATDAANVSQVQSGAVQWCGTAGGTADALTLTPAPALAAYAAGVTLKFKSGASPNTGAATVDVSSLGAIAIQLNGAALAAGDIEANQWYQIVLSDASTAQLQRISSINLTTFSALFVTASQAASQSEMEAAASTTQFATAGNVNWHPGVAKAWIKCDANEVTEASHNISSITDTGPGVVTITMATGFSTTDYCITPGIYRTLFGTVTSSITSSTVFVLRCFNSSLAAADPTSYFAAAFGDQ